LIKNIAKLLIAANQVDKYRMLEIIGQKTKTKTKTIDRKKNMSDL